MFDEKAWRKEWVKKNQARIKTTKERFYLAHPGYNTKYWFATRERQRERHKKWLLEHPEYAREYSKTYYLARRKQMNEISKAWRLAHPEEATALIKKWRLAHPEQMKEKTKQYSRSPKGKEIFRKNRAKRRKLGFIPLNKPFPEARGHHVDWERVIYVPKKMHESVKHSVLCNYNMEKINLLAWDFLNKTGEYCENINANQ